MLLLLLVHVHVRVCVCVWERECERDRSRGKGTYHPSHPLPLLRFSTSGSAQSSLLLPLKVKVEVAQLCPTLWDPMDSSPPGSSIHGDSPGKWVAMPSARGSSQLRDRTQVSCFADSWPSEAPGKPKNTGVGSLSLLQGIFSTQESNRGLLHCRRILYQLSYQGSPELHSYEWLNNEYYGMHILS